MSDNCPLTTARCWARASCASPTTLTRVRASPAAMAASRAPDHAACLPQPLPSPQRIPSAISSVSARLLAPPGLCGCDVIGARAVESLTGDYKMKGKVGFRYIPLAVRACACASVLVEPPRRLTLRRRQGKGCSGSACKIPTEDATHKYYDNLFKDARTGVSARARLAGPAELSGAERITYVHRQATLSSSRAHALASSARSWASSFPIWVRTSPSLAAPRCVYGH